MESAIYIHEPLSAAALVDRHRLRVRASGTRKEEVTERRVRHLVHRLTHADVLVVPDAVDRCTPVMERLKTIARNIPIEVLPLGVYIARFAKNEPAAAAAEPHTQQGAACGLNLQPA